MNDEMFIKKYEELLDKGYCDCNEMNCIDNNTPRRILNVVKNLQQENQELKKQLEELEKENLNLREYIMTNKMAIPYEEIKDKSLYDLYDIPSYIDLVEENQKYKEVIDKTIHLLDQFDAWLEPQEFLKLKKIEKVLEEVNK